MVRRSSSPTPLIAQDQALYCYFETLLGGKDSATNAVVGDSTANNRTKDARRLVNGSDEIGRAKANPKSVSNHQSIKRRDFLALFFDIGNLRLATPLQDLSRTIDLPKQLNHLPNYPATVIGSLQNHGEHIILLDTPLLFEFDDPSAMRQRKKRNYQKALIIRNSHWGIPCDKVTAVLKVTSKEIQWRRPTTNKPWLLGIEINHLRSLVDFNRLIALQTCT